MSSSSVVTKPVVGVFDLASNLSEGVIRVVHPLTFI
jgi:hypothetical protein